MILWIFYHICLIYPFYNAQPIFLSCNDSAAFSDCQAITIQEELLPGTVINTYKFEDPSVSSLTFKITPLQRNLNPIIYLSISARPFEFDLVVASRVDKEEFVSTNKHLNFYLDVSGGKLLTLYFYVTIKDIDDNFPIFERPSMTCPMKEKDINQTCLNLTVIDADQINNFCKLEVIDVSSGSISDFLVIVTNIKTFKTGFRYTFNITLKNILNYTDNPLIQLQIQAMDSAGHKSVGNVFIPVTEVVRKPPTFLNLPYFVKVNEEMEIGTSVITVKATDGNWNNNSVEYSLKYDNNFYQYFDIDPSSGNITISQTIDREFSNISNAFGMINLFVVATVSTPSPSRSSEVLVQIQILDINDSPVIFGQNFYQGTIPENSFTGTSVYTSKEIVADDADLGSNAQYSLIVNQNSNISDIFEIYPVSGMNRVYLFIRVKNRRTLDYEMIQYINLTIEARQITPVVNISETSKTEVFISILDMNDNSPVFVNSTYKFTIKENSPKFTPVGKIVATDKDSGVFGQITYSLNDPLNKFAINSTSGLLYVNVNADQDLTLLDRELYTYLYAVAVATDGGGLTAVVSVIISLLDVNDNPPVFDIPLYQIWITENSLNLSPKPMKVKATDKDIDPVNNLVHYQIIGIKTGPALFVNNFQVNLTTGEITIFKPVDREIIPNDIIELQIRAYDVVNSSFADTCIVQIIVLDVNDNAPRFSSDNYFSVVAQNISANLILMINATDADEINTPQSDISFRLIGENSQNFIIETVSGTNKAATIRKEATSRLAVKIYAFVVEAFDHGYPSLSTFTNVTIKVTEINDESPVFNQTLFSIRILENLEPGSLIGQVTATDSDFNCNLSYSILQNSLKAFNSAGDSVELIYNLTNSIGINQASGAVFIQSPLDREKTNKLVLQIQVIDLAAETFLPRQTAFASLEINVLDVNDNPPVFQSSVFSMKLYENFPAKSTIGTGATDFFVTAKDVDTTGILWFNNSDPTKSFSVDPMTGQIFLLRSLDRETLAFINFTVWCNDGVFSVNATVMVTVLDVNDNAPYFVDNITMITISEDTQVGSTIAQFTANDLDSGENARVVFLMNVNPKFILTPDGILLLASSLTSEQIFQYQLMIEIMNKPDGNVHLRNSKEVTIHIIDVNDNYPTFEKTFYEFTPITEREVIGYRIGEILATDKDIGENANITYDLLLSENNANPIIFVLFQVQKVDGKAQIMVKSSLNKRGGRYTVILRAMDNGIRRLYNNCTFVVSIIDFNDFAPNFTNPDLSTAGFSTPRYSINENTIGVITTITAYDADSGINGEIRFDIVHQNGDDEFFIITPVTGNLRNIRIFDREKKDLYKFRIVAYDLGSPSLSSFTDIEIAILDQDDNLPVFPSDSQNMNFSVFEGSQMFSSINNSSLSGFKIGNVGKAIDLDIGENDVIVYLFIGDTYLFYLDPHSADLYGLKEFDRETVDHYKAIVKAIPKSQYGIGPHPVLPGFSMLNCSESNLLITIVDINDNPPKFTMQKLLGAVISTSPSGSPIMNISKYVFDEDVVSQNNLSFYIIKIFPVRNDFAQKLPSSNVEDIFILNSTTGILYRALGMTFQENIQGYIEMMVGVSDGKFEVTTQCIIYFVNQKQRLIIVIKSYPSVVREIADELINYLSNNTGINISWDSIELVKDIYGYVKEGITNLYIHAVNTNNNAIIDGTYLLAQIDQKASELSDLYKKYQITEVKLATSNSTSPPESEHFYKLILIIFVCFVGILFMVIMISICICRSKYQKKLKAYSTSSSDNSEIKNPTKFPGTNYYENDINPFSETKPSNSDLTSPKSSKGMKKIGVPVYRNDISFDQLFSSVYPNFTNSTFKESTETGL